MREAAGRLPPRTTGAIDQPTPIDIQIHRAQWWLLHMLGAQLYTLSGMTPNRAWVLPQPCTFRRDAVLGAVRIPAAAAVAASASSDDEVPFAAAGASRTHRISSTDRRAVYFEGAEGTS